VLSPQTEPSRKCCNKAASRATVWSTRAPAACSCAPRPGRPPSRCNRKACGTSRRSASGCLLCALSRRSEFERRSTGAPERTKTTAGITWRRDGNVGTCRCHRGPPAALLIKQRVFDAGTTEGADKFRQWQGMRPNKDPILHINRQRVRAQTAWTPVRSNLSLTWQRLASGTT